MTGHIDSNELENFSKPFGKGINKHVNVSAGAVINKPAHANDADAPKFTGHSETEEFSSKEKKPFSQAKNAIKGAIGVAAGTGIAAAGAKASGQTVGKIAMALAKKANASPETAEKILKYLEKHPKVAEAVAKGVLSSNLYERIKAWDNEAADHPIKSVLSPSYFKEGVAIGKAMGNRVESLNKGISTGAKAAMIGGAATAGITGAAAIIKGVNAHQAKKLAAKLK